jgi:adenylate cyclase
MDTLPKVKYPIGLKLIVIITALLLVSLGSITVLVSILVNQDVRVTAEDNNYNVNRRAANSAESVITRIMTDTTTHLRTLAVSTDSEAEAQTAFFLTQNPQIAAIFVISDVEQRIIERRLINTAYFTWHNIDASRADNFVASLNPFTGGALERAANGVASLLSATQTFGTPMLALLYAESALQAVEGARGGVGIVLFSADELQHTFGASAGNTTYMLNIEGELLVHQETGAVDAGAVLLNTPFVREMFESGEGNRQTLHTDGKGNQYFAASQKLPQLCAAVITLISYDEVFSGIAATTWRTIAISVGVLLLSILTVAFFSKTISKPLKALTQAAIAIETGNYELALTSKSRDEIGILTQSFMGMSLGLMNFERFTNKAIIQLARQGNLTRTGVGKNATICFTLIRDFSERMEHCNAEEVVQFVNAFLSRMVPCITSTGGVVDKFLTQGGVVIMSLWGAVELGGTASANAAKCVQSALMMRDALKDFNKKYSPFIKIGCGINSGEVVAGQMGSDERMEYTVIGDAVNLAARLEGPNDLFDTDILISEDTWRLLRNQLIIEEMPSLEVKGKEEPLRVFAVVNMVEREGERTLAEVRQSWGDNPA